MELTLSDELVARAHALAAQKHTTVEGLLEELVRRAAQAAAIEEFLRLADEQGGCSEPGWRFQREECYGRSAQG